MGQGCGARLRVHRVYWSDPLDLVVRHVVCDTCGRRYGSPGQEPAPGPLSITGREDAAHLDGQRSRREPGPHRYLSRRQQGERGTATDTHAFAHTNSHTDCITYAELEPVELATDPPNSDSGRASGHSPGKPKVTTED